MSVVKDEASGKNRLSPYDENSGAGNAFSSGSEASLSVVAVLGSPKMRRERQ